MHRRVTAWTMRLEWNWRRVTSGVDGSPVTASASRRRLRNDRFAIVGGGEAQVQFAGRVFSAVGSAQASLAGAEPCPKPGKVPAGNGEPLDAVGGAGGTGAGAVSSSGVGAFKTAGRGRARAHPAARTARKAGPGETGVDCLKGRSRRWFFGGRRAHRFLILVASSRNVFQRGLTRRESMWAYLPVGPLERQFMGG